jgi:hypothetical protein
LAGSNDGALSKATRFRINALVSIKNVSDRMIGIATRPTTDVFGHDQKGFFLLLKIEKMVSPWGDEVVIPESELGIARTAPGETAVVKWEMLDSGECPKQIRVIYEVDDDIGKRYGLWSGTITVESASEPVASK